MNGFEWVNATSVEEAVLRAPGAVVKAGGIDLMDLMKERIIAPSRLVNLRTVQGLDRVAEVPAGAANAPGARSADLSIGPLVTLARVAADPTIQQRYRALADACGHAATPQIRNAATIGGNLLQRPRCWYFRSEEFACRKKGGTTCFAQNGESAYHAIFDNTLCAAVHASSAACALVAHGATLEIAGANGRRSARLDEFFTPAGKAVERENTLGPGEIVTAIRLPPPAPGAASSYVKLSEKESFDWPLVEVAAVIEQAGGTCTRASIVVGAVAHAPLRLTGVERALAGKRIDEAAAIAASQRATIGATPTRDNGYKVQLVEVAVKRAILAAAAPHGPSTAGGAR